MNRPMARRVGTSLALCALGLLSLTARAEPTTPRLEPPAVLKKVDAVYPLSALEPGPAAPSLEVRVVLRVSISREGRITEALVLESGGAAFDTSAQTAVRQWQFTPARRNGRPIDSRIAVPFRFVRPPTPKEPTPKEPTPKEPTPKEPTPKEPTPREPTPKEPAGGAESAQEPQAKEPVLDVHVAGRRKVAPVAVSDFVLGQDVLTTAPAASAAELLQRAPGVYVSRPEGDAVAHEIYLRGFNAEHGQDIELTVGGIPINQLSHIHGQGYADLNFVIPEVVRSLRVTEGVYDPAQGDFAIAGSVGFDLGVVERGYHFKTTFGSYGALRQLALWAPEGEAEETFAAVAIRKSTGFGANRGSSSGGGIGQYAFNAPGGFRGLAHFAAYGARANIAGVLRRDDVDAGRVGFFESYANPSANSQSAFASRAQVALTLERATPEGARTELGFWLLFADYRSRMNFTGYLERSQQRPEWVGRGDLMEQWNRDLALGARALHRTPRLRPTEWARGNFEFGLTLRTHFIDQTLNLLQPPLNETWDKRVDTSLQATDLGLYASTDWKLTRYLRLRGGVRADVLYFDIDDRLSNFIPSFMREQHLPGYRRTALGVAIGPRASLEVTPLPELTLIGAYGEGYRSPNARQLEEGENAPFATVRSFELGLHAKPWRDDRLVLRVAAFATLLSQDIAFDPSSASLERIGPTTRRGLMAQVEARPWSWLFAQASVTWVHATLDQPPPASVQDPVPAFTSGQLLPYVPPIVVRADIGVHGELIRFARGALTGRAGLGFSHLTARPLPYGRFANAVTLVDISGSLRWRYVEVGLEIFNLFDSHYAATEYSFVSDWRTRPQPSLVPARHLSAGPPFSALCNVALHF